MNFVSIEIESHAIIGEICENKGADLIDFIKGEIFAEVSALYFVSRIVSKGGFSLKVSDLSVIGKIAKRSLS